MLTEREQRGFETIQEFMEMIKDIAKEQKGIALWNRLINNPSSPANDDTQGRCIQAFRIFCLRNKKAINDGLNFSQENCVVRFSPRVYININSVLKKCTEDDRGVVREYLLTISALLSRDTEALQQLTESTSKGFDPSTLNIDSSTPEGEFFSNVIGKISETVGEGDLTNTDPQTLVMKLMASGVMNDVMFNAKEKFESGELNVNGIMNLMQGLMGGLQPKPSENTSEVD